MQLHIKGLQLTQLGGLLQPGGTAGFKAFAIQSIAHIEPGLIFLKGLKFLIKDNSPSPFLGIGKRRSLLGPLNCKFI